MCYSHKQYFYRHWTHFDIKFITHTSIDSQGVIDEYTDTHLEIRNTGHGHKQH